VNRTVDLSNIVTLMKVVELSGGVGGAKLARGFAALAEVDLTVVVNIADDDRIHGLHISPDIDTVIYTLAGAQGPEGWGRRDDSFRVNDELARFGVDNRFRLGDLDLALNLFRTSALTEGRRLSGVTAALAEDFELTARIIPASDDPVRTKVRLDHGWTDFQDYFVLRGNRDEVHEVDYQGAEQASPAPGVLEAIAAADLIVIGPSNPPLSIWPILAVPGVRRALEGHPRVTAVSPLFGGKALKGPADRVMASLGLAPGNAGIVEAYRGLIHVLVVDVEDARDGQELEGVRLIPTDTRIPDPDSAARLASEIIAL
jgi:LPPG:FO 2-phospho-L-lactate transferase